VTKNVSNYLSADVDIAAATAALSAELDLKSHVMFLLDLEEKTVSVPLDFSIECLNQGCSSLS